MFTVSLAMILMMIINNNDDSDDNNAFQVASEAAMRAPEEVYKGLQQGAPKAAQELSREERTRLRAKKKRAGKKRKLQEVSLATIHFPLL